MRFPQWLSNCFHPLLALTYVAIVLCIFTPMSMLPFKVQAFFVGMVAFYTFLLPALVIVLMHICHVVGHWSLRDRRDRALPFFTNFVCYLVNAVVMHRYGFLPSWVLIAYDGAVFMAFVLWVVSLWWKISAHAIGLASASTYYLVLLLLFPTMVPLWFCMLAIVITGAVGSTRVYLGRHTLAQVGAGALTGIVSIVGAALIML